MFLIWRSRLRKIPIYDLLKEEFTEHGDIIDHVQTHGATKEKGAQEARVEAQALKVHIYVASQTS